MPLSPTRLFVCTACGATLPVGDEHVGKKCRCGRCGAVSVVADDAEQQRAEQSAAQNQPLYFHCRVCDTRLGARVKHIGRKAKCPDCGALTVVPPLPKQQPKQPPRAMHGQQYGVWGIDDAPSPAEMSAKQPKYFPVYCRVCDTLMHARPDQVGKQLQCPDCGAQTQIKAPPPPEAKKSALVPDGSEYQLDTTHIAPIRPGPQFMPIPPKVKADVEDEVRVERERPKMPSFPTLQGVPTMLSRSPVPGWWLGPSLVGLLVLGLLAVGLAGHILVKVIVVPPLMFFSIMSVSAASEIWLTVLTESSEGNDRIYNPPGPVFLDWLGNMLYLITAGLLAMAPWWLLCRVLEQELSVTQQGIVQACGWLFTFPLLLLSCLENGSPMELFSPKIFGSLSKVPGHWLLLFLQSVALAGGSLLAVAGLLTVDLRLAFLAMPLLVAAGFLYFRLLGRFAWWLAESLATEEAE